MFEKISLKTQFKLLLLPIMVLATILVSFISYSEYQSSQRLRVLEKDIHIVEDLRKLMTFLTKERKLSLKFLSSDSRALERRVRRSLGKQRAINNARVKSLKKKLSQFSSEEIENRAFLKNVVQVIEQFETDIHKIRAKVNKKEIETNELLKQYSSFISKLIYSISKSSLEIQDPVISRDIAIYSMFLKYLDSINQRNIFLERVVSTHKITPELTLELSKIEASKKTLTDIISGLLDENLFKHYNIISTSKEFSELEKLNSSILENGEEAIQNLTLPQFLNLSKENQKKLKELNDYISIEISTNLNIKIDNNKRKEILLTIIFLISTLMILVSTYVLYNNLRQTLFFGTLKIKSSILRVITDINLPTNIHGKNEIKLLISLVSAFVKLIKNSLSKIRANFREIVSLSNHLSESSETIVNHIQKQSKYLEDINLQMTTFLEDIRNSEISFENLKEIIEDSSAKINNLNLDITYISYEVLNLKDLDRKIIKNKEKLKDMILSNVSLLNNSQDDEIKNVVKDVVQSLNNIIIHIDEQTSIVSAKEEKLSNLTKTALAIKKDAEINGANLSDILGVITILGYETKAIVNDINSIVEESESFINVSKHMVDKSELVSSDVKMLNKHIVNLDREFNKFHF